MFFCYPYTSFCFRFLEFSTQNKQVLFQVKMFHEKNPFQIDIKHRVHSRILIFQNEMFI